MVVGALLAVACKCSGQETDRIVLGPLFGYGIGAQFSEAIPVFAGSDECGLFAAGTGTEFSFGVRFSHRTFFSPVIGLVLDVQMAGSGGALVAAASDPLLIFDGDTGGGTEIGHEYRFNQESQLLRLDLAGTYALGDRVGIRLGGWGGYRYRGRLWQIDTITSGLFRFSSTADPSARVMLEGEQLSPGGLAFGAVGGVSWSLPLWPKVSLQPELFARIDLGSFAAERRWQMVSGGLSVALLVDVSPAPQADRPPDTPTPPPDRPTPPPAAGRVTAQIDLYGTDENNVRLPAPVIRVYETYRRVRSGRLDQVRFEQGSSEVPQYYPRLSGEAAATFSIDSLEIVNPGDLRRHMLNIIGQRLRAAPLASLVLSGMSLRTEPVALAQSRADDIRRYLEQVWQIDSARITSADVGSASREVMIGASVPEITQAAVVEWMDRRFDPPLISIDPLYRADAGVRQWMITVSHDGQAIGHISSGDTDGGPLARFNWAIADGKPGLSHSMLMAELSVEDSLGSVAVARSQTPLTIQRQTRVVDRWESREGNREVILHTLYPFQAGRVGLAKENMDVMAEIAREVRRNARVGVIDAAGTPLSAAQAHVVLDALAEALRNSGAQVALQAERSVLAESEPVLTIASAGDVVVIVQQDLPAMTP